MSSEIESGGHLADIRPPVSEADLLRLQPTISRMALRYADNEHDREDFVQQANVALLTREGWTSPFLLIRSAMRDYKRHKRSGGSLRDWDDSYTDPDPFCLQELSAFEGLGLEESDREVARLYFVEKMSQPEISKLLGNSRTTVDRALERIREAVRVHWIGGEE